MLKYGDTSITIKIDDHYPTDINVYKFDDIHSDQEGNYKTE